MYDERPDREYDPTARVTPAGTTGRFRKPPREEVIWNQATETAARQAPAARQTGFGGVTSRRMLEVDPPRTCPWLTVDVAERELAMLDYARDRAAVTMDSVAA